MAQKAVDDNRMDERIDHGEHLQDHKVSFKFRSLYHSELFHIKKHVKFESLIMITSVKQIQS